MLDHIEWHCRLAGLAFFDFLLGQDQGFAFRSDQLDFLGIILFQNAANNLSVLQGEHDGLETLGNLPIRVHDRFKKILAGLLGSNSREVGTDVTALALDLVTAQASRFGLVEKDVTAGRGVSAPQGLLIAGNWIVLLSRRQVLGKLLLDAGGAALLGGLE